MTQYLQKPTRPILHLSSPAKANHAETVNEPAPGKPEAEAHTHTTPPELRGAGMP